MDTYVGEKTRVGHQCFFSPWPLLEVKLERPRRGPGTEGGDAGKAPCAAYRDPPRHIPPHHPDTPPVRP